VRQLGAGAYGQVWLCEETESNGLRAVKVMTNELAAAVPNEVRILQEAVGTAGETYVPRFYEASAGKLEDGHAVQIIVMEFIDGVSAGALARAMAFPEICARIVLADVASALTRLHGRGIVHCDIKGDNVLVNKSGCKLCDFGVSSLLTSGQRGNGLAGTPGWMAPEMACIKEFLEPGPKRHSGYDAKVDVWSLGILAVELAIGDSPWRAVALEQGWGIDRVMKEVSRQHVPEKMGESCFSEAYFDLVNKCLEREPSRRPTAQELRQLSFLQVGRADQEYFETWIAEACANAAPGM